MEIILENFRSFVQRQSIPITPLTFLVGENSSGKSTFLAALSAVEREVMYQFKPQLSTPPYDLGSFDTIATYRGGKYGRAKDFTLGVRRNTEWSTTATFVEDKGQPVLYHLETKNKNDEVSLKISDDIAYLSVIYPPIAKERLTFSFQLFIDPDPSALRSNFRVFTLHRRILNAEVKTNLSSEKILEISDFIDDALFPMGTPPSIAIAPIRTKPRRTYDEINDEYKPEGDHIPVLLSRVLSEESPEKRILIDTLQSFGITSGLFKNVKVKRLGKRPSDPFQIIVAVAGGREANIMDVGYGVNQALPVLVESILASPGRKVTMQQPEVHLHPRAQAALGSFMVDLVQKHKKQFVVETHSDYIVDRVRQEVAAGRIDKDKVSILFFEKPGFETTVHQLRLDKQGNILNAPASYREFFLEEQMNLLMA
jgi:AAA domain, putative AbiEii toxin, Type IV TA system/Protein of unknown function (DUF3696)